MSSRQHTKTPLAERFWAKVDREDPDDCWLWLGFIDKGGYGRIRDSGGRAGGSAYAHRISYELSVGAIPDGLVIDHRCGNRWCVNPSHLEPVTNAENVHRGDATRSLLTGRCDRGHDQSVHGYISPKGKRNCRECRRLRRRGLAEVTERQHQKAAIDLAHVLHWRVAHFRPAQTNRGWRTPVEADGEGWPDLTLLRERILFLELKTERGKLSDPQKDWIRALDRAGVEIYVPRPRHLELLAVILSCRGNPYDRRGEPREAAATLRAETLKEAA